MQHLLVHLDYSALVFHPRKKIRDGIKEREDCENNVENRRSFLDFYAHFNIDLFSQEDLF